MTDAKTFVGTYIGKKFKKKGTKKDNTEWTMNKYMFKERMDAQYEKEFTGFAGFKGEELLKEGELIKVGFVLSDPFEITTDKGQKKMVQSKRVIWVDNAGADDEVGFNEKTESTTQSNIPLPNAEFDTSSLEEFKEQYLATCKEKGANPDTVHMVGAYFATYQKELSKNVVEFCAGVVGEYNASTVDVTEEKVE